MGSIRLIGGILQGSPWWVYPLLALLGYLGLQAARPRIVGWRRVVVTPVIFILWGIASLAPRLGAAPLLALDWLAAAALAGALALTTVRLDLAIDRDAGLVRLPGSWLPLARVLAIFAAKYALAVAIAIHPEGRGDLVPWDIAVSGVGAGYFLGWLVRFALACRAAPDAVLAAPPRAAVAGSRT